jgi:phage-related protein
MAQKRRLLHWEGSSKKDFKEFPIDVQKDLGVADHRGDTFRAVYTVRFGDAVHVLHAFQKKSKSGIATPQPDVELIEKRLKVVLARYGAGGRT